MERVNTLKLKDDETNDDEETSNEQKNNEKNTETPTADKDNSFDIQPVTDVENSNNNLGENETQQNH